MLPPARPPGPLTPSPGDALLVIDVQRDFLPGGALGVPDGDAVIPVLNRMVIHFVTAGLPVYATRDWHPPDHCSFTAQGGPWPPHCIRDTPGAEFSDDLALPTAIRKIVKAVTPERDCYSGFDGTDLANKLRAEGIRRLFVGGLATDYCVLNSVLDARREGFEVVLLLDAIRAVDLAVGDGERAITEMLEAGAVPATETAFE